MGHCPDFTGTTRTLRLPGHPSRLDFVSFVMDGTTAASGLRFPQGRDAPLQDPDASSRGHPRRRDYFAVEMAGSPKFPLEPSVAMHMLWGLRTNRPTLAF